MHFLMSTRYDCIPKQTFSVFCNSKIHFMVGVD